MSLTSPSELAGSLVVVRHGQTQWSLQQKHTGLTDVPLTPDGEAQARAGATAMAALNPVLVLASPKERARRTAALLGLDEIETDSDLVEWDYGGYEGLTTQEISDQLGRPWQIFEDGVIPGDTPGETVEEVAARASRVLRRVYPYLAKGNVVLVAHGHTLRILASVYLRQQPRLGANLMLDPAHAGVMSTHHDQPTIDRWNLPVANL